MILFTAACSKVHYPYQYTEPASLDDGWQTMHMDSLNVDTSAFYQLFNQLNEGGHKVHSILLVKEEKLIVEEYFGKYDTYKQHDLRSVSKSIRSILMGIAIDEGFVDSQVRPGTCTSEKPGPKEERNFDPKSFNNVPRPGLQ
jgi:hypothetical protein